MNDFSMARIFRRGFGGVFDPRGRDSRTQYWIHVALVFGPLIAVQVIAQIILTFPSIDFVGAHVTADPEQINMRFFVEFQQGLQTAGYVNLVLYALGAMMLLSATARRLQDRGRHGAWAYILPLTVVATSLDQARRMAQMFEAMPKLMLELVKNGAPNGPADIFSVSAKLQTAMPGPHWTSIVAGLALLVLVVELVRAGSVGENQFGPQP